jgi:hypothetical protein
MNPLLDETTEKEYDRMIDELDKAGYNWNGSLVTAPDGYQFFGILNLPLYLQVYKVYDYHKWISSK